MILSWSICVFTLVNTTIINACLQTFRCGMWAVHMPVLKPWLVTMELFWHSALVGKETHIVYCLSKWDSAAVRASLRHGSMCFVSCSQKYRRHFMFESSVSVSLPWQVCSWLSIMHTKSYINVAVIRIIGGDILFSVYKSLCYIGATVYIAHEFLL